MRTARSGFSLVELSIVLAILGVVTAGGLSVGTTVVEQQANIASNAQLDEIDKALQDFYKVNGYVPCPADPTVVLGGAGFGVPVNGGVCTAGGTISNTTASGGARIGALPVRALGLRDRSIADEFGNRYTYAVTRLHTDAVNFTTNPGAITIYDGGTHPGNVIVGDASYVVLSHGSDGKGARRYQTATVPVACAADNVAGARDNDNCDNDANFRDARFNNGGVVANFYDDFIRWLPKFRLTNTTAASALWQQNGTSIYYNAGNVGIGTNTPNVKLQIAGGDLRVGELNPVNTGAFPSNGRGLYFSGGPAGPTWDSDNSDAIYMMRYNVAGNQSELRMIIGDDNDGTDAFRVMSQNGATTNMIVRNDGNVGIGSAVAGSRLVVTRAAGGADSSWAAQFVAGAQWLTINPNSSAGSWTPMAVSGDNVIGYSNGGINTGALTIAQWSSAARGMRIDASGNVGIGTSGPQTAVEAAKDSSSGVLPQFLARTPTNAVNNVAGMGFATSTGAVNNNTSLGGVYGIITQTAPLRSDIQFRVNQGNNSNAVMFLTNNGDLGIGAAPSYRLHVNGTAYATAAAGALSDIRHKKNVQDLDLDGLSIVEQMRPVTFEWKDPTDEGMQGTQLGFIAQEVEKILPSVILTENNEEHTKGMKYNELIPVLTKSIQQLKAENDALKARIDALETADETVASVPTPSPYESLPITLLAIVAGAGATYAAMRKRR